MNYRGRALSALLFVMAGSFAAAQTVEFVDREVLVKFKGTTSRAVNYAKVANMAIGAKITRSIPRIGVEQIKIPAGMSRDDALFYYGGLGSVEYAEPNSKKVQTYTPNDPQFFSQYGPKKVKAPEGWNLSKGKSSVVIAILDSGIDFNHEDLKNKLVTGYDFSDNDSDPSYSDAHGVHCAGIAAAETDNGKGVAGTGFNCKIMPIKIFPNATDAVSATSIIYAADHGAKVISMSYGSFFDSATERNAVNYAWGKGVVLLAASGNAGVTDKFYPAAHVNCIAVGSTGPTDQRSGFSNYGPDWVDVGAPGEDVLSTVPGGYAQFTGTSMSCPMAAGVVGLLWSFAQPGTTNVKIRQILESTTDPNGGGGFKYGRVNAFKGLSALDPGSATLSNPSNAAIWTGSASNGSASDLLATDANYFVVTSEASNLGQLAGAIVDIAFNGPTSNLSEAQALIEANSSVSGTSGQLYLWNYSTNKFVLIKAFATQTTAVKREKIALPLDLTNYVSGGNLRMGIRAIGPNRLPGRWNKGTFDFKLGFVQVSTRENLS
jgi:thermitase